MRRLLLIAPFALVACGIDAAGTGDGFVARADTSVVEEQPEVGPVADTFVPPEEDTYAPPPETAPLFDAADESPLPGCTSASREGHDYLFCELDGNWDQARTTCQIAGYDLAIVKDKAENDWLVSKLKSKSRNQWSFGLNDREKEGTYKWIDGSAATFTSWGTWEPNDWLWKEDCGAMNKDGSWNDIDCGESIKEGFICETP